MPAHQGMVAKGFSQGDTSAQGQSLLFPHQHMTLNPAFTGRTNALFGNPSHPEDIAPYASPEYLPAQTPRGLAKTFRISPRGEILTLGETILSLMVERPDTKPFGGEGAGFSHES